MWGCECCFLSCVPEIKNVSLEKTQNEKERGAEHIFRHEGTEHAQARFSFTPAQCPLSCLPS